MLADRLALPFDIDDRRPFIGNTNTFQLPFGLHLRASRETALHLIFTAIRWDLNNIFMKMAGDKNKRCGPCCFLHSPYKMFLYEMMWFCSFEFHIDFQCVLHYLTTEWRKPTCFFTNLIFSYFKHHVMTNLTSEAKYGINSGNIVGISSASLMTWWIWKLCSHSSLIQTLNWEFS